MKKKNRAEQYFTQKDFSALEIILISLSAISGIISTFIPGGGPVGFPVLLICLIAFYICRSRRVKDDEIEEIKNKILQDNQVVFSDNTIVSYEINNSMVKKKKNGELISPNCYITDISTTSGECMVVNVYTINIVDASIERTFHNITGEDKVVLTEETINTPFGLTKISYLKINNGYLIPVKLNDYKSSQLIEKICCGHEKS